MGSTIAEKILGAHAGSKTVRAGDVVVANVDFAMVHDARAGNALKRGGKTESPATGQLSETPDPVLKKAKITVAAKMENPASAEFVDMKRAMRENAFGQPFEVICGHVKGKKKSGEATGVGRGRAAPQRPPSHQTPGRARHRHRSGP